MKESIFSFGEKKPNYSYRVLDEHLVIANAKVMFSFGLIAFIGGFILREFWIVPIISGFMFVNFIIGIFLNKFMPTQLIAKLFLKKQKAKWVGAVQKRFAFSLGSILTLTVFIVSNIFLQTGKGFAIFCLLCLICIFLIGLEAFARICVGCKIYGFLLNRGLIKRPKELPKCMGDHCELK